MGERIDKAEDGAKKAVKKHPNTTLATTTGTIGIFVVYLAGLVGIKLNSEQGALTAVFLITAMLFIGREGIRGLIVGVWRGFNGHDEEE
jgi:hypothetical protein